MLLLVIGIHTLGYNYETFYIKIADPSISVEYEIPYISFSFSEELNRTQSLQLNCNYQDLQNIATTYSVSVDDIIGGFREIYLFDSDENKIFGGYLAEITITRGQGETGNVSITAKGFFNLLAKRYTDAERLYTSDDASDIAWDLIDYTQGLTNGDLGITRGANPTTVNRDRTFRYREIADAIIGLSNIDLENGFDFEITPDKEFNVYYPTKGTARPEIIMDSNFNILTYQISRIGIDGMVNQVIVIGEGMDIATPVVTRTADSIYAETYYLQQGILSEKDTSLTANLSAKGDKYLSQYKYPRYTINFTTDYYEPHFVNYQLGDTIKIVITEVGINENMRVFKRGVNDKGIVSVTLRQSI